MEYPENIKTHLKCVEADFVACGWIPKYVNKSKEYKIEFYNLYYPCDEYSITYQETIYAKTKNHYMVKVPMPKSDITYVTTFGTMKESIDFLWKRFHMDIRFH